MFRRILLSAALGLISYAGFSQTGTIKGSVKDAVSGDVIVGANVLVAGTALGTVADVEGNFEIAKVKAGTYNLIVSFISYKTDTLKGVTVYPDQATVINHTLTEESQTLTEIVVTGTKVTNTNVSVMTELKTADLVAVGISQQQISLSQDRDAAQVMRRLPGVTITGGRFVNVRGLSERYNTVMLNGVIAPSTEVDSKAFAFDLIPSGLIDRMLVYKSGSSELPGEMGGAVIGIYTKSIVEENSLSFSLSTNYRVGTTFANATTHKGASTDWLGYDDGSRDLPASFPSLNLREVEKTTTTENYNKIVKSLPNNWGTTQKTVTPDLRANLDFSHLWHLGGMKLGNVTSLSYSRTNQLIKGAQTAYYDNASATQANVRYNYSDDRYSETARIGLISNFTLELNPSHKIEFRNFFNQQGMKQTTVRSGQELLFDVNNLAMNYNARSIYSGQLQGTHSLSDYFKVTWIGGYGSTVASQPDYRRIGSRRNSGSGDEFEVVIPPGASLTDAGRFYSNLTEKTYTGSLNLEYKINPAADDDRQVKIIAGGYYESKSRDFKARWMSYKWNTVVHDEDLRTLPFTEIFAPANLGTPNGFTLEEGTNEGLKFGDLFDQYRGSSRLIAGYASAAIPFAERFRFVGGLRFESFMQQLDGYTIGGIIPDLVNRTTNTPMPFANLSYSFSEKMLIRAAYSHTVNRPVFREIAPFKYYDFDRTADMYGNPSITTADIHNFDLKWEFYPTKAELVSVSAFYKNFLNPIELFQTGSQNIAYTFAQGKSAYSYGVEAEIRKSLAGITSSGFINKLDLIFNAALIKSEVRVDENNPDLQGQIRNRPLQGQSPYVVNAGLIYNDNDHGFQASLMYNVIGKRIFAVGDLLGNRTQYEMPKGLLDFTLTKQLSQHFDLKFGVQDILNQYYRVIQDSNQDQKIDSNDDPIQKFKTGQLFNLGLGFRM